MLNKSGDSGHPCLFLIFFFFFNKFIYLFLAVLGLRFCVRAFSSCSERGPLHHGAWASHYRGLSCWEHRLQTCRLSSCGSQAQLLHGMWDLPRPGLEPVSPALAGRFSTTAPPGKPSLSLLKDNFPGYRILGWCLFLFCFSQHFKYFTPLSSCLHAL